MDFIRRVKSDACGAHAALDHGLALSGSKADRIHPAADDICLVVTFYALGLMVYGNLSASNGLDTRLVNGIASLALILLAIYLALTALLKVWKEKRPMVEAESF